MLDIVTRAQPNSLFGAVQHVARRQQSRVRIGHDSPSQQ